MPSNETRFVNQCTYTPIVNSADIGDDVPGFVPAKPFLKQAILSSVLNDRYVGELLLEEIAKGPPPRGTTSYSEFASVVRASWAGDSEQATAALRHFSFEDVATFAERVLETERELAAQAQHDVDESIAELATDADPSDKPVGRSILRAELDSLRESILAEVRRIPAVGLATFDPARIAPLADAATPSDPAVAASVPENQATARAGIATVTRQAVQQKLASTYAPSAAYLAAARYFNIPQPVATVAFNEVNHLLAFTASQLHVIGLKQRLVQGLIDAVKVEPVGFLQLERLQFTPVGYERGELVYTLPLVPGETVRLTHRDWTRTESEYATIQTTSLETATQDALSEKSELTESLSTQEQHGSAFNASVTASGGFGPVNISTTVGYNATNAETVSRQSSARRAQDITRTASSRSKKELKISFRIVSEAETEETSYREIANPLDRAVRWDFYRLMKKWQIDLYRYDVRMTYDLVIPEPGSYLLRKYIRLANLTKQLNKQASVELSPESITRDNYLDLAATYQTAIEAPPDQRAYASAQDQRTYSGRVIGNGQVEITLPEGYEFESWRAVGSAFATQDSGTSRGYIDTLNGLNSSVLNGGARHGNSYSWRYLYDLSEEDEPEKGTTFSITVWATGRLARRPYREWQLRSYERLLDAARGQFEANRQRLMDERDELLAELRREDALTLRKMEKEEIMKGVLRWVLGPDFSFYPLDLPKLTLGSSGNLEYYEASDQSVRDKYYEATIKHGEIIKFLHHAIEWENVNYVLYPYFWTDDFRWDFKQDLFHEDFEHRSFLRAGAARVVLPIRRGFEQAFLSYMETASRDELLPRNHPYITLAEEVKAIAETKYRYTPDANQEDPANRVDTWFEFTPTGALDVVEGGND